MHDEILIHNESLPKLSVVNHFLFGQLCIANHFSFVYDLNLELF